MAGRRRPMPVALEEALGALLDRRDADRGDDHASGARATARGAAERRSDEILDGYQRLAQTAPRRRRPAARHAGPCRPLVSAIVPYFRRRGSCATRSSRCWPRPTRGSRSCSSTTARLRTADWVVAELAAPLAGGRGHPDEPGAGGGAELRHRADAGAATCSRSMPTTSPSPSSSPACVEVLEARPDVAYVTSWSRYIDEDGAPLERPGPRLPAARQPGRASTPTRTWPATRPRSSAGGSSTPAFATARS